MVALTMAWGDELRCRISKRTAGAAPAPLVPLEGVHMARQLMYVSSDKARAELGYNPSSATEALGRAVRWYRDHGYAA